VPRRGVRVVACSVAALVMQTGLAHLCSVTSSMTQVRSKIDVNIPRKRLMSSAGHDKAMARFFEAMGEAIAKFVDFSVVKCLVIASPGFLREDFSKWLFVEAVKRDNWAAITDNKAKFLLCHSSSGFKHSLREVLADPAVAAKYAATTAHCILHCTRAQRVR
jgi:protein pelota